MGPLLGVSLGSLGSLGGFGSLGGMEGLGGIGGFGGWVGSKVSEFGAILITKLQKKWPNPCRINAARDFFSDLEFLPGTGEIFFSLVQPIPGSCTISQDKPTSCGALPRTVGQTYLEAPPGFQVRPEPGTG